MISKLWIDGKSCHKSRRYLRQPIATMSARAAGRARRHFPGRPFRQHAIDFDVFLRHPLGAEALLEAPAHAAPIHFTDVPQRAPRPLRSRRRSGSRTCGSSLRARGAAATLADELFGKVVDYALRAATELGRNAFGKRGDLGNPHPILLILQIRNVERRERRGPRAQRRRSQGTPRTRYQKALSYSSVTVRGRVDI
jgi:hypothetical protein